MVEQMKRIDYASRKAKVYREGTYSSAAEMSAIVAQFVAAMEIHWSWPCGKPLSKYGWNGIDRLRTYHDPSSSWVDMRSVRKMARRL